MMMSMLMMATVQGAVPPPAAPVDAVFAEHVRYDILRSGGTISSTLQTWRRSGAIRGRHQSLPTDRLSPCLPRELSRRVDVACVRRLLPPSEGGVPVVAIIPRHVDYNQPIMDLTCVGPRRTGRGRITLDGNGVSFEARATLAACINAALPGAVRFVPGEESVPRPELVPPETSFTMNSGGGGFYFYQQQLADCREIAYWIGRNGVGGGGRCRSPTHGGAWRLPTRRTRRR